MPIFLREMVLRILCPDFHPLTLQQLEEAAEQIHRQRMLGKTTYVHCKGGRERSPMAIIAYLMKYHHLNLKEAKAFVQQRPLVHIRRPQQSRLEEYAHRYIQANHL